MKILGKMIPSLIQTLTKKTDTILYPAVKPQVSERFRGALTFTPASCVGCKLCMKVCPVDAIRIEKTEDSFKAIVRLDRCIYCGQCVDSCRKDALHNSPNFELAQRDKSALEVEI